MNKVVIRGDSSNPKSATPASVCSTAQDHCSVVGISRNALLVVSLVIGVKVAHPSNFVQMGFGVVITSAGIMESSVSGLKINNAKLPPPG